MPIALKIAIPFFILGVAALMKWSSMKDAGEAPDNVLGGLRGEGGSAGAIPGAGQEQLKSPNEVQDTGTYYDGGYGDDSGDDSGDSTTDSILKPSTSDLAKQLGYKKPSSVILKPSTSTLSSIIPHASAPTTNIPQSNIVGTGFTNSGTYAI
jgi:hypothetical protein